MAIGETKHPVFPINSMKHHQQQQDIDPNQFPTMTNGFKLSDANQLIPSQFFNPSMTVSLQLPLPAFTTIPDSRHVSGGGCFDMGRVIGYPAFPPAHVSQSTSPLLIPVPTNNLFFMQPVEPYRISDMDRLAQEYHTLTNCSAYYPKMNLETAHRVLKPTDIGTFLIRNSSTKGYMVTISVKTCKGVTSIRIVSKNGLFYLHSEPEDEGKLPGFQCILELIQYYVIESWKTGKKNCPMFLERSGKKDIPVLLKKTYQNKPQSLKSLCRKTINKHLEKDRREIFLKFFIGEGEKNSQLLRFMHDYCYFV